MERQSREKILQLKAVCTTLPFVLSTRQRAPRGTLGDYPLVSMYDECHTYECITTFVFLSGTGFDQSARGLAALSYIKVLPAVRQVVCRHPSHLFLKVAAQRIDCPTGKSQRQERMPTRKTAKD